MKLNNRKIRRVTQKKSSLKRRGFSRWLQPKQLSLLIVVLGTAIMGAKIIGLGKAATPPPPPLVKPNIVLILTDDQTMDSLNQMSYTNSRADWFRFTRAFFNNPLCCPSRATLLSGQYSHHTGVEDNNQASSFNESSTVATWLNSAGYQTALFGKYLNAYPWGKGNYTPPGWSQWGAFKNSGGYYNYKLSFNGTTESYGSTPADYSTTVLQKKATDFIAQSQGPFFLYFSVSAPHYPTTPAPEDVGKFAKTPIQFPPNFMEDDVSDKPAWWRSLPIKSSSGYTTYKRTEYETMQSVDRAVKGIFDSLATKGVLDNTVVIFMTDNGWSNGSHRWSGKRCPYEECIQTPLLIRYPGRTPRDINGLVSNVDIAPTIAAMAGVTPASPVDGFSLLPLLDKPSMSLRDGILIRGYNSGFDDGEGGGDSGNGKPPSFWGIRKDRFKYIETEATGEKELYDLQTDPYELQNLYGRPDYASNVKNLAAQLAALKAAQAH